MSRKRQCFCAVVTTQNPDITLNELTRTVSITPLDVDAVKLAGDSLISESVSNAAKADFLVKWQQRGETVEEVAALADFFRSWARDPGLAAIAPQAIDIVGTGGDKSGTFNISTTTAIIVAAGGVPVIKHGNRSITSQTGSADLLEAIGIPLQAEDNILQDALHTTNFTFLFAPAFHPAFKTIVPVRKELAAKGAKTVFNILGPLINPARPAYQLMGVFSEAWVAPLAEVLTKVGVKSGVVACSKIGNQVMDELTTIADNTVSAIGEMDGDELELLAEFIQKVSGGSSAELKGGDHETNLKIFRSILSYEANPSLLNTLCLNAGVAFKIARKVSSFEDGFEMAQDLLKGGKVSEWVQASSSFYASTK